VEHLGGDVGGRGGVADVGGRLGHGNTEMSGQK
jgi:hypothetical protein